MNPQSGSLPRDCPEKKAKIKDRGKFGYVFANHELATTFTRVCVSLCMTETEIGERQGCVMLRRVSARVCQLTENRGNIK